MLPQIILPQISGGASTTGEMGINDVAELRKALDAGYGTDVSTLQGGAALRIQSLEKTMLATIQENKHFRLFNEMAKTNATATVDEWTEQSNIGGFLGGSTNTETGVIAASQGAYNRRVGLVKYLMTRREVSFVASLQNAIVEAEAVEAQNGALQLLTDAEFLSFEGDSTVVPTEFDGIYAQQVNGVSTGSIDPDHILDAAGSNLASVNLVNKAAAIISAYGNFGTPTHIFMSQKVQADFDTGLDPAFRVPLANVPNGGIMLGAPVAGIRTSWGDIKTIPDVFIRDEAQQMPFEVSFPTVAAANVGFKPASVVAAAPANNASSGFTAAWAGNYYYYVTGVNSQGQSTGTVSAQVAIAAGQAVTLTITASAGGQETGYVIYRSRTNGGNSISGLPVVTSDFRQMVRVAKAGATTTYTDLNTDIPGTSKAFILNMTPGSNAITWRQMLPMLKFPLYPTVSATIPWAQLMFGYLRIGKRRHHVVVKNIVADSQSWKPNSLATS